MSLSIATSQVVEEVKKVPKSKTWFLGGRMAKAKAKGGGGKGSRRRSTLTQAALEAKANAAASEVTKEQQAVVKREPKPADPLVFLGSEDIVLDVDKGPFTYDVRKTQNFDPSPLVRKLD